MSDSGSWSCTNCDERTRDKRNCHNRKKLLIRTAEKEEWQQVGSMQHVLKVLDTKFFECPVSFVTRKTWEIIKIVTETSDNDGRVSILPYKGAYMDQPKWYRDAVRIVRENKVKYLKSKQNG